MLRYLVKLMIAVAATGLYLLALRFIAPSSQPYFMFGIAIVGLITWLIGAIPALIFSALLVPLTNFIYQQFSISTSYVSVAISPPYIGLQIIIIIGLGYLRRQWNLLSANLEKVSEKNDHLNGTLLNVQEPGGIHHLCGQCKSIQDDAGIWYPVAEYLKKNTKMEFSHCICPDCADDYQKSAEKMVGP